MKLGQLVNTKNKQAQILYPFFDLTAESKSERFNLQISSLFLAGSFYVHKLGEANPDGIWLLVSTKNKQAQILYLFFNLSVVSKSRRF